MFHFCEHDGCIVHELSQLTAVTVLLCRYPTVREVVVVAVDKIAWYKTNVHVNAKKQNDSGDTTQQQQK